MLQALPFLWRGLLVTLAVSALVVVLSLLTGIMLGLLRVYGTPPLQAAIQACSDIVRGIPVLVLIFFVFYGLPAAGLHFSSFSAGVLALAIFSTAQVTELARGALQSIHPGQNEAAKAIGLRFGQRMTAVILPQAARRFLPGWVNSVADAVKGSALVSLIGVVDLMLAIQQVIGRTYQALPLYLLGGAIYFAINYGLSLASRHCERRLSYYQARE
ncbi:amino acid ABC transporter permease [Aquincola sp. S2]|uniref:Amino acid ABC transporter permease n=2 Tax=Pseudaquabacterium terrae TaxID=2732868 RepID=A0ABX2EGA9_9BURK|nr:amino acid ABC transporter permease [Aquabacterium terrae]